MPECGGRTSVLRIDCRIQRGQEMNHWPDPRRGRQRPRNRWDRAPEDLARSTERDRARFSQRLLIDPRPWAIARLIAPNYCDGYGYEGMRGLFQPDIGEHGQIIWWPAAGTSHHQGMLFLGMNADTVVLEVEINTTDRGLLYPCWTAMREDSEALAEAFNAHPTMRDQRDGYLSRNGRLILLRDRKVRLCDEVPNDRRSRMAERAPLWEELMTRCRRWAATRRATMPDGSPVPPMDSIAPFRAYVSSCLRYGDAAVPEVTVLDDGAIVASWRTTGSLATIRFSHGMARPRINDDGEIIEYEPVQLRHERNAFRSEELFAFSSRLLRYRSRGET